jgi:rubredoxin
MTLPNILPEWKDSIKNTKKNLENIAGKYFGVELIVTDTETIIRWVCLECHYIYDPVKGDPKNGVAPGTAWKDVPDTWRCPECKILKAKKGVFKPVEN